MIDPSPGWYVLHILSGQEDKAKQLLQIQIGDQFQYIIPKRKLRERKAGKWYFVERKLFPGYILLKGVLTIEAYYNIAKIPNIIKFLKDQSQVLRIDEKELRVLNILIDNKDSTVEISTVYKENDNIRVTDGPLVGLEGHIISVNPRKGRAKVKLSIANQEKVVELGVEVISNPE